MRFHLGRRPWFGALVLWACALGLSGCGPSVEERRQTAATTLDQSKLADLGMSDSDDGVRATALARLKDQELLAQVVISTSSRLTDADRKTAFAKITSQAALQDIVLDGGAYKEQALARLTSPQALLKVALDSDDKDTRAAAVAKLEDQRALAKAAVDASDDDVRRAAILKLTDQGALYRVATGDKVLDIRTAAIDRMTDQTLLTKLATEQKAAAIRLAAVSHITDNNFLLVRSRVDISNAVRTAAVQAMTDPATLARVAMENDSEEQRDTASGRIDDSTLRAQIDAADQSRQAELDAIAAQPDENALARSALEGKFDVVRAAAAHRLHRQSLLGEVASKSRDREVCKIVFYKLDDANVLRAVAGRASDGAMRLAASVKAGQLSWREVFDNASKKGAGSGALGEALAAVAFFPHQEDAQDGVVQACLNFINRGDESRIPELIDMLDQYGDVSLAEDYLNCGQPDLDSAARSWASAHGYNVASGNGSHRASWGSER